MSTDFRCAAILVVSLVSLRSLNAADEVMQKSRAAYAALRSYSDSGVVIKQYSTLTEHHAFVTLYRSPRLFLFDFKKEGGDRFVIWSDEGAFHTWWKSTDVQENYPKGRGNNAFLQADYLTSGSGLKIPALLFAQSGLQGAFANFSGNSPEGTEDVSGKKCYKIPGTTKDVYAQTQREVNVRKMTVWIDAESLLIRKVFEDAPENTPAATAIRVTTILEPHANPVLDDGRFRFAAPGK